MSDLREFDPQGEFVEAGGVLFRRRSSQGEPLSQAGEATPGGGRVALTGAAVGVAADAWDERPFAFRAEHHIVITAPGPKLEEYAALFVKLCRPRVLRQLFHQLTNRLTLLIYLLLGLREFLFGHRSARGFEGDVVPSGAITREAASPREDGHEHGDSAREKPGPQIGSGVAQVGHDPKPSTWAIGGLRWQARADLILALLGLVVFVPALGVFLALAAARMAFRMVTGR